MNRHTEPAIWFPAIRTGSGTDSFTEQLAKGLLLRGIHCEITWLPHHAEYLPWLIKVPSPPPWANLVHVNTWLHRRFIPENLPLVATMHLCVHDPALHSYKGHVQTLYHRYWVRKLEQQVISRADSVVAVSHYTAQRTGDAFHISLPAVIHNGIDLAHTFTAADRSELHSPFRLLYAGNWSSRKGTDLLSPIMETLGPDFELCYTPDRSNQDRSDTLPGNCHSVQRQNTPEAMARLYQSADALLFPSRLEGLPLAVIEAQACGLPVIASHCSSMPEAVVDGETGLLCRRDDIDEFVAAARLLASDPALWLRMSRVARAHAERHFAIERMIDAYLELYRGILP
ncbi:MAG: glycosyltransferase family 4 protein [Gammaproteobacteria bacterium]|nr:glycosyltransferase family 4 protein [Gammaproteobacteria bacterium]MBU1654626.1 glycosyltransferase family 4 protein [Gammaproteobacteria bacterium]MBU1959956.1 glycosyltransferase family 4 protein [Gammaproteobacteria bacterium]